MSSYVGQEMYDAEKGPEYLITNQQPQYVHPVVHPPPQETVPANPAYQTQQITNWRFLPNFMTVQVPGPVQIDPYKLTRKLNYKYIGLFLLILSIVLSCVSVGGCSDANSSTQSIYILEARYHAYQEHPASGDGIVNGVGAYQVMNSNANHSDLVTRIGYFGTCIMLPSAASLNEPQAGNWTCSSNATYLSSLLTNQDNDPFNLVYLSNQLRYRVMNPTILIMSIVFTFVAAVALLCASMSTAHLFFYSACLTVFSCILELVAMVWQQSSADTARNVITSFSSRSVHASAGSVPAGLGWTSFSLLFVTSIGLVWLVISENRALVMLAEFGPDYEGIQMRYGAGPAGAQLPGPTAGSTTGIATSSQEDLEASAAALQNQAGMYGVPQPPEAAMHSRKHKVPSQRLPMAPPY